MKVHHYVVYFASIIAITVGFYFVIDARFQNSNSTPDASDDSDSIACDTLDNGTTGKWITDANTDANTDAVVLWDYKQGEKDHENATKEICRTACEARQERGACGYKSLGAFWDYRRSCTFAPGRHSISYDDRYGEGKTDTRHYSGNCD